LQKPNSDLSVVGEVEVISSVVVGAAVVVVVTSSVVVGASVVTGTFVVVAVTGRITSLESCPLSDESCFFSLLEDWW
jgi:hypothetical protein